GRPHPTREWPGHRKAEPQTGPGQTRGVGPVTHRRWFASLSEALIVARRPARANCAIDTRVRPLECAGRAGAATALWVAFWRRWKRRVRRGGSAGSKAAWRFASRRTPKKAIRE